MKINFPFFFFFSFSQIKKKEKKHMSSKRHCTFLPLQPGDEKDVKKASGCISWLGETDDILVLPEVLSAATFHYLGLEDFGLVALTCNRGLTWIIRYLRTFVVTCSWMDASTTTTTTTTTCSNSSSGSSWCDSDFTVEFLPSPCNGENDREMGKKYIPCVGRRSMESTAGTARCSELDPKVEQLFSAPRPILISCVCCSGSSDDIT